MVLFSFTDYKCLIMLHNIFMYTFFDLLFLYTWYMFVFIVLYLCEVLLFHVLPYKLISVMCVKYFYFTCFLIN